MLMVECENEMPCTFFLAHCRKKWGMQTVKEVRNWGYMEHGILGETWNMGFFGNIQTSVQCLGVAGWEWEGQRLSSNKKEVKPVVYLLKTQGFGGHVSLFPDIALIGKWLQLHGGGAESVLDFINFKGNLKADWQTVRKRPECNI